MPGIDVSRGSSRANRSASFETGRQGSPGESSGLLPEVPHETPDEKSHSGQAHDESDR